jgi:hypothetical protein
VTILEFPACRRTDAATSIGSTAIACVEPGQDRQHRAGVQRDRGAGVGAVAEV